jgi:hypothetical protein
VIFNSRRAAQLAYILLSVFPAGLHAQRIVVASSFPGADLGAQIVAADAGLGANPGMIVINQQGKITSHFVLAAGHSLELQAPTTWLAGIDLLGGNTISCSGEKALMTVALPSQGTLLRATQVRGVQVDGCWMRTTNPGGDYYLMTALATAQIAIKNCHSQDLPLLHTGTTGKNEEDMTPASMSSGIGVSGNSVSLPSPAWQGKQATGVLLVFSRDAEVSGNSFQGGSHGVQWWGGDANRKAGQMQQSRRLSDLRITGNTCRDVRGACYWGSWAQHVSITHNSAENCGDVCIDAEGNNDVTIADNTVKDGHNGGIATFFFNRDITITHNQVTSSSWKYPLFKIFNSSQAPFLNQNIKVTDNNFRCEDPARFCLVIYQAVGGFVFSGNKLLDTLLLPAAQQTNTEISRNTFVLDRSAPEAVTVIRASHQINGGVERVSGNVIQAQAPQPAGSVCLYPDRGSPPAEVSGNTCSGQIAAGVMR